MSSNPINDLLSLESSGQKRKNNQNYSWKNSRKNKKLEIEGLNLLSLAQKNTDRDTYKDADKDTDIIQILDQNTDEDIYPPDYTDILQQREYLSTVNQSISSDSSDHSDNSDISTSYFSDSHFSENNENDSSLYDGASLTVERFSTLFIAMIKEVGISKNKVKCVLEMFRLVLPLSNNIPNSYDSMLNKKDISKLINYYYVCTSCKKELNKKSKTCQTCGFKKISKCITSDVKLQLEIILGNHMKSILKYKGNID